MSPGGEGPAVTLDAFHAAAARADGDALLALFAADGVFLGTDATERWAGPAFRDFVRVRFAGGQGWSLRSVRRELVVRGDVAWFDEDLVHGRMGALRGTGVLVREAGGWRVRLYDLSIPVPNERWAAVQEVLLRERPPDAGHAPRAGG